MPTKPPPSKAKAPPAKAPQSNVIRLGATMFSKKKVEAAVAPILTGEDEDDEKIVVLWLPQEEIDDNPFQPRTSYKPKAMAELRESMEAHGQIQTAVVRWNEELGRYQFAVGHRRRIIIRSGVNVGPKKKPKFEGMIRCEIRRLTDLEMRIFAIEENDAREEMNPIDRARAYVGVYEECKKLGVNMTWQEVAELAKMTYRQMHRYVELLTLPPKMIAALETDQINATHGAALLDMVPGYEKLQGTLFRQILSLSLSGAATVKLGKRLREMFMSRGDQLSLTTVSEEWDALAREEAQKILEERKAGKVGGPDLRLVELPTSTTPPTETEQGVGEVEPTPGADESNAATGDGTLRLVGGPQTKREGGSGNGAGGGSWGSAGGGGSNGISTRRTTVRENSESSDKSATSEGLEPSQNTLNQHLLDVANMMEELGLILDNSDVQELLSLKGSPEWEQMKEGTDLFRATLARVEQRWEEAADE